MQNAARRINDRFGEEVPSLAVCSNILLVPNMLETDRLLLREWRKDDRPQVRSIFGDPEVMQFSDHGTLTPDEQTAWFERACKVYKGDVLSGALAISQKSDDSVVGYISLSNDHNRVQQGDAELGFRLSRRAWGQGYASEAAARIIHAAEDISAISRIVAIVDPHNKRSVRVLEKLGLSQVAEIMFDGYDYPDAFYALQLRSTSPSD